MKIKKVSVKNFKKFKSLEVELDEHFNLIVGNNGSGKTSILDALAIGLGVWLLKPPAPYLSSHNRTIQDSEIRLEWETRGDREQFEQCLPVEINLEGALDGKDYKWSRLIKEGATNSSTHAKEISAHIKSLYKRAKDHDVTLPVVAYYGAGRAWLPSNRIQTNEAVSDKLANRWVAFNDCFSERIRWNDLQAWVQREHIAAAGQPSMRLGYLAVERAVTEFFPGAKGLGYDADREQMVLKMEDGPRLFSMLSAGQRVMLLMVLDIAVRSVSQNAHMLKGDEYYKVITDTPGVILIDELDVHLHPSWQRLVAAGLKNIFQAMQFVCTTHSPQMIGELMPNEVLIFEDGTLIRPSQSYGLDSNFILNQYMNTNERDQDVKDAIFLVKKMIAQGSISQAEDEINRWIAKLGGVIGPFQQELAKIQKVKLLRG